MKHADRDQKPAVPAGPKVDFVAEAPVECASSPCMMAQFPELTDGPPKASPPGKTQDSLK